MLRLGLVTYNIAARWDLETLIARCTELGYTGVELRTTHAHRVEPDLTKAQRDEARRRFADSPVTLVGLGTVFEFHAPDAGELRRQIEGAKTAVRLASDVGAGGIKVRPNAFPEGVPRERTIEQIGCALREIGLFAAEYGVRLRLEVHGRETARPEVIRQILDCAGSSNAWACWNSNETDLDARGSIDPAFDLLRPHLDLVHIHALYDAYPYARLFARLQDTGYDGYCLAELPASPDAETVLRYYRELFLALSRAGRMPGHAGHAGLAAARGS